MSGDWYGGSYIDIDIDKFSHARTLQINPALKDAGEWRYTSNCWICEKWFVYGRLVAANA